MILLYYGCSIHTSCKSKGRGWILFDRFFLTKGYPSPLADNSFPPVLVVNWWYWVSILRYWLVFGSTGLEQGGTGCQCDMLSENIWLTWCKPLNYSIFGEGKSDYGQANKSTDRISYLRLDPFCGRGRAKLTHSSEREFFLGVVRMGKLHEYQNFCFLL